MATYETKLRETRRFEAVDAEGRPCVVVEHLASLHRLSLRAKPFEPIDGGRRYSLLDGRELLRRDGVCFDTVDGSVRIFALNLPDEAVGAQSGAPGPSRSAPGRQPEGGRD